jgi:hypothetical protein
MADTIKAKVIGELPVCGVSTGGYVDLDPDKYNIQALVDGGHIELSKTAAKALDGVTAPTVTPGTGAST